MNFRMKKKWVALSVCLLGLLLCATAVAAGGQITPNGGKNSVVVVEQGTPRGVQANADTPQIINVVFDPAVPTVQEPFTVTFDTLNIPDGYQFTLLIGLKQPGEPNVHSDVSMKKTTSHEFNVSDTMSMVDMPGENEYYMYFVMLYDENGNAVKDSNNRQINAQGRLQVNDKAGAKHSSDYVEEIVAQNTGATQYETALLLHDYLINHAYYDTTYIRHGAGHIFVHGYGVCDSYRKAYGMLLDKAGIQNTLVENSGHAWNAVKLDGKWYQVDCTWDDPSGTLSAVSGSEHHLYFMVPDQYIAYDHTAGYENEISMACVHYDRLFYVNNPEVKDGTGPLLSLISWNEIKEKIETGLLQAQDHEAFNLDPLSDSYICTKTSSGWSTTSYKSDLVYDQCVRYLGIHQGLQVNGTDVLVTLAYDFGTNVISVTSGHVAKDMDVVAATCLNSGFTGGKVCEICGAVLLEPTEVPALGHDWGAPTYTWAKDHKTVTATRVCNHDAEHIETEDASATGEVTTQPTCEGKGKTTYTSAAFTNGAFTVQTETVEDIDALGHDWDEPTYSWTFTGDGATVTATRICKRVNSHKETEDAAATGKQTKDPTCTEDGETTYSSNAFENKAFTAQMTTVADIPSPGHLVVEIPTVEATCTEAGHSGGTKCAVCEIILEEPTVETALGHDWEDPTYEWAEDNKTVTATHVCKRDEKHTESEPVEASEKQTKDPTCTEKGETTWTSAAFKNEAFTVQIKKVDIDPLGHDWDEPIYVWAGDNKTVTASRVCKRNDEHIESEPAEATDKVTKEPTCEVKGETTWTSAEFTNEAFAVQTKKVEIDALGHDWDEPTYEWAEDNKTVTATHMCKRDEKHTESEPVEASDKQTKDPTCTEKGETTWTSAAFTNEAFVIQIKKVDIDPLGHDWDEPTYTWAEDNKTVTASHVCKRNGEHTESEPAEAISEITKPATCEEKGETTWTSAAFKNEAFTVQIKKVDIDPLPHKEEDIPRVEPTYMATGLTEGKKCSVCGTILQAQEVIPKLQLYAGEGLTCDLTGEGALTVSGNGAIEKDALSGLDFIRTVSIAKEVTAIGENAFSGCVNLTEVTLANGVATISRGAFSNCESLKKVTVPESVTDIGEGAFSGCAQLTLYCIEGSVAAAYAQGHQILAALTEKVDPVYPVKQLTLNQKTATLTRTGKAPKPTLQLKVTVDPDNATDKTVTWKSSNPKIATVDNKGKVTALKAGSVTITCKANGGNVSATCKVTVKDVKVSKIKLNKSKATVKRGKTLALKVTFTPASPANQEVTWKSSNSKIATVNKSGKVTGKKAGTVTITCTSKDGKKKATCKITVK